MKKKSIESLEISFDSVKQLDILKQLLPRISDNVSGCTIKIIFDDLFNDSELTDNLINKLNDVGPNIIVTRSDDKIDPMGVYRNGGEIHPRKN